MSQHTQFDGEFHDAPQVPYEADYGRTQEAPLYQAGYAGPPPVNYPPNASALYPSVQAERSANSPGRLALAILSLLLVFAMFVGALLVIGSYANVPGASSLIGVLACLCALVFSAVVLAVNLVAHRR